MSQRVRLVASILLGMAILLVLGAKASRSLQERPLPVLATVPAFTLTAHTGEPFGLADLKKRVWVVDFVYTGCSAICPKLTARMTELQTRLETLDPEGKVGLLSITVDPKGDTPERLSAYASRAEAKAGRWVFLTGEASAVKDTVVRGFKVAMGEDPSGTEDGFAIVHGGHLLLVDRAANIRGYYDPDAVETIARNALALVAAG